MLNLLNWYSSEIFCEYNIRMPSEGRKSQEMVPLYEFNARPPILVYWVSKYKVESFVINIFLCNVRKNLLFHLLSRTLFRTFSALEIFSRSFEGFSVGITITKKGVSLEVFLLFLNLQFSSVFNSLYFWVLKSTKCILRI